MVKFNVKRISLYLALIIASHAIFSPLNAWIDHFFDFHPVEIEADWMGSKEAWKENDVWAEIGSREEGRSKDRDNDRGTCPDGPDRDK